MLSCAPVWRRGVAAVGKARGIAADGHFRGFPEEKPGCERDDVALARLQRFQSANDRVGRSKGRYRRISDRPSGLRVHNVTFST